MVAIFLWAIFHGHAQWQWKWRVDHLQIGSFSWLFRIKYYVELNAKGEFHDNLSWETLDFAYLPGEGL